MSQSYTDKAHNQCQQAENAEKKGDYQQARDLYQQQSDTLRKAVKKIYEHASNHSKQADQTSIKFLECLSKTSDRKVKFMDTILKDPSILYDTDSIKKSIETQKEKERERQRKIKKGLPVENEPVDSDTLKDSELFQFVRQEVLDQSQTKLVDFNKNFHEDAALLSDKYQQLLNLAFSWMSNHKLKIEESKQNLQPPPTAKESNNPFVNLTQSQMRVRNGNQKCSTCGRIGTEGLKEDEVKVNQSELKGYVDKCASILQDLDKLKDTFYESSSSLEQAFKQMKFSFKYEAEDSQQKGTPFYLTRGNIEKLAESPIGYGFKMMEAFDKTKEQRLKLEGVYQDVMNQSMMVSQAGGFPQGNMNMSMAMGNTIALQNEIKQMKKEREVFQKNYKQLAASFESNKEKLNKAKQMYPELTEKLG